MPFSDLMRELKQQKTLVDIRRDELDVSDIRGHILDVTGCLVLIGVVADDIRLDGYSVISRDEVSFLRWGTDVLRGWQDVLNGRGGDDETASAVDITDWWRAIGTIRDHTPLLTFHRERFDPRTCYISDEFEVTPISIVGRQITTDGMRNGSFAIKMGDLTRIDFGGSYEHGLKRMLSPK